MGGAASMQPFHVKKVEKVDEKYYVEIEHVPFDVSRNINVLFVCDEWGSSKGGLSTFNREFAVNFATFSSNNIKVHCYVCDSNESERQNAIANGVNLIFAKHLPGASDPVEGLKIPPDELRHPHVVVGHGRKFGVPAQFIASRAKCRWVQFVHVYCEALGKFKQDRPNSDAIAENERKNNLELELCKKADLTVAVGAGLQKKFARRIRSIKVITPGIFKNFDINPKDVNEDGTGQEFGVFMFGRGSFEDFLLKGYDVVGKAIASLGRKFKLTFVGAPKDEHRNIETWFCEETNIARNQLTIRRYCGREEMKEMFSEADVIVMPSRTEGFGLIALEAISAGVPVLISTECGISKALEEVDDGIMSVVIDSELPEAWAKKIRELSEQSPGTRETNAIRLRENYGKKYDWERECKKFELMILDLMKKPRKSQVINFLLSDPGGNMTKVEAVISLEGNGSLPTDAGGNTAAMSLTGTSDKRKEKIDGSNEGVESAGSTTISDKEALKDKGGQYSNTDDVPHSSLELGKTERNDQRESAPGKASHSSVDCGETERNKQGQSVSDSGTATTDSTEKTQRNKKEVFTATGTAIQGSSVDSKDTTGRTSLMKASLNGSVRAVKGLIERGADPSLLNNRGWNALHFAAQGGDTDVIDLIFTHLPDIESKTAEDLTPLMVAAFNGKLHAVKWFLEKGANVTCVDNRRWDMLHFTAQGGNTDVIDLIFTHLPDIESKTAHGYTPLMVAAFNGKLHTVKWFLEKGANVTCVHNNTWNMLHFAAHGGDTDVIDLIFTHLPDIEFKTAQGNTPLMVAALNGKLHAVKWFLEKGANVTCVGNRRWKMLHFAAKSGDTDVIDLIFTHLPDIESKTAEGLTPLMVAAFNGKLHAVKWFLEKGANVTCVDNRRWNMLHFAAQVGDTDVIDLIFTHLPDIESKTAQGYTPLKVGACNGKLHAVKWFLEKGANVTCVDNRRWNMLHSAAQAGDTDVIDLIFTHLPDIESKTAEGYTPLMVAAVAGKLHAVKWFLEKGANVSCVDNRRWNMLHFAAQAGDTDVIDLIFTHLLDIESKTAQGYTPLMVAALAGKLRAVKWFLEKGANVTCVNNRRWNMLHVAAHGGDTDVIDLIFTHLPDIESKTACGSTPLIIAVRFGKLQGVKYLLERGANPLTKDNDGRDSLYYASSRDPDVLDFLLSYVASSESASSND